MAMIKTAIKYTCGAIASIALFINAITGAMVNSKVLGITLPPIWLILIAIVLTLLLIAFSFYLGIVYVIYAIAAALSRIVKNIPSHIELEAKPKGK